MPACDIVQRVLATLPRSESDLPAERFLAVPADGEPRWLLPQSCRDVDSALSSWSPYRFSSRFKWQVLRAASRVGAAHLLPNARMTEIAHAGRIDWRSLGWRGRARPMPVIYVGTPGICRKAVIHLVDRESGKCEAIVKLPLATGAKQAILREAGMLGSLAEEKYTAAPQQLFVDHERGVSTQTFVPGMSGERRFSARCGDLLQSLMLKDETTTIAQHAAALEDSIPQDSHSPIVRAALTRAERYASAAGLLGAWRLRTLEHQTAAGSSVAADRLGRCPARRSATARLLSFPAHAGLPFRRDSQAPLDGGRRISPGQLACRQIFAANSRSPIWRSLT